MSRVRRQLGDAVTSKKSSPSLKLALETASREVRESPTWLKTIYARNRAIAAAIQAPADEIDPRYVALRRGLEQLSSDQLRRILEYEIPMCFDRWNYDEDTGRY